MENTLCFKTGDELESAIKSLTEGKFGKFKNRDFVDRLASFCLDGCYGEIGIVYGLRSTGKTVGMLQAAEILAAQGHKAAYARFNRQESGMRDVNAEIARLAKEGITHFFLDGADSLGGFLNNSDWPDKYRIKIVISGTDSFLLWLAMTRALYQRHVTFSTNLSTYPECKRVLGKSFDEYKRKGGLFLESEEESAFEIFPGAQRISKVSVEKFIEVAIVENLTQTLERCNEDYCGNYYFDWLYAIDRPVILKGVIAILKSLADAAIRDAIKGIPDLEAVIGYCFPDPVGQIVEQSGICQNSIKIDSPQGSIDALLEFMVKIGCLLESGSGFSDLAALDRTLLFAHPALMNYAVEEAKHAIMETPLINAFSESLSQAAEGAINGQIVYFHLLTLAGREDVIFRYQDKEGREVDAVVINRKEKILRLIEIKSESRIDRNSVFKNEAKHLYDDEVLRNIGVMDDFSVTRVIAHSGENELVFHEKGELFLLKIEQLICRITDLEQFLSEVRGQI